MRPFWIVLAGFAAVGVLAPSGVADMQCDCGDMDKASPGQMLRGFGVGVVSSPITWSVLGAGILGLGVWGWRAGWIPRAAAGLALWSRFDADDLDDHPTRSKILGLLRDQPGAATRDLAELAGLNAGTLLYHLEVLARFGLVNSQRVGRERAWYLTRGGQPDLRRLAILGVPARQQLFDLIQAKPGSTQADLARITGLSAANIHHHLQALADAGLVHLMRDGSRVRCYPVDLMNQHVGPAGPQRSAAPAN